MTLELSGVRLVAENAAEFFATMRRGDAAMASFAQATGRASADAAAFARATQQIKLDTLNNQLRDQQTRLGILKQQLAETAAKYGEASTQAQAKAAAVARLGGQVSITEQKIALLAQQMAAEADAAGEGTRTNHQLGQSLGDVEAGAGQAESALQRIATGALHKIGALGVEAFGRLTDAAITFVAEGVRGLADYQSEIAMLGAVSGASGEELNAAAAAAKALGSDLTLPTTSAGTAAEAMTELTKAGLSVREAIDAAKGTLQVATIEELSNAEAAEIVAGALNMFGLAGKQATLVADEFAATSGASAVSVKDLAIATANGGSVWAAFQGPTVGATQALTDFNTALGLLGNAGIKGSSAGTALKNAMLFLAAPTSKANDLMHELLGNIGMTGTIAFDASGKMRSFPEILDITARATAGLSEQQRDAALKMIFGGDAVSAIIPLLKAGGDGWADMAAKVVRAGAANDLAGAKMTGINGAVKGLQSGLETLALNGLEPLAPLIEGAIGSLGQLVSTAADRAGPAMTVVAHALVAVGEGAPAVASAVQSGIVPALGVATAAALTYAAVNSAQVGIALVLVVQRLALATAGLLANAAAAALAVAPYALIAAAIGGVILAYTKFNDAVKGTVQDALDSRQWWNDAGQALTDYGNASSETQARLSAHAATIRELRSEIQGELEDLTRRAAAGMLTDAQYQTEMATINAKRAGLIEVTDAMEAEIQAQLRQQAASLTGTAALQQTTAATQQLGAQVNLTEAELAKLSETLDKTYSNGAAAVQQYVTTEQTFLAQAAQARADGNTKALADQAAHYAAEQAAQSAHLGQMLMDYTATQVAMGNMSSEAANVIMAGIEKQFGITQDVSSRTFLQMTADIDRFAASGSQNADALAASLNGTMGTALDTKSAMDALAKKYEAELIQNFQDGKIDADQLAKALRDIPSKVYSEVIITEKRYTSGAGDHVEGGGISGTRASGGPVALAKAYLVGEKGPEVFVPNSNGYIIPNHQLRGVRADGGAVQGHAMADSAMSAATMLGMPARFGGGPGYAMPWTTPAMGGAVTTTYQDNRQYTMPVYTNNSPGVLQQGYYTMRAQIL